MEGVHPTPIFEIATTLPGSRDAGPNSSAVAEALRNLSQALAQLSKALDCAGTLKILIGVSRWENS